MSMELSVSEVGAGRGAAGATAAAQRERDREFRAFVQSQRDRAVALVLPLLGGDREASQDAAQDAFIRAHGAWESFRGAASRRTWFTRILLNCARSQARKQRRRQRWSWLLTPPEPAYRDAARAAAAGVLSRARIGRALATLTDAQREVFVLVHLEGLTISEAAQVLGKPPGTAKSHLHRALASLRRQLGDLRPNEAKQRGASDE